MRRAIVAWERTPTNVALARAADWLLLDPLRAQSTLGAGDTALARLDVRRTLDGVEVGFEALGRLAARGVTVLNDPSVLLSTHDKLLTARLLDGAGIPHPETHLLSPTVPGPRWSGPVVVKPRFGSWGLHVVRCDTPAEFEEHVESISGYRWFRSCGAIVQGLVPPSTCDLRIIVAGRRAVGAVVRVAADGEWRTNVALGARRVSITPPAAAVRLAVAAAVAVNGSLVGVDLLPCPKRGWIVLEVNGAVEFNDAYSFAGDVFATAAESLAELMDDESRLVGAAVRG